MATAEHRLISRIIISGDIKDVVTTHGIVEDDFLNLQCRGIFSSLYGYWRSEATRNSVPSEDAFRQMCPAFELVDAPHMTTQALCHEVKKARNIIRVKEAASTAVELADTDPLQAAALLRQVSDSVISHSSNVSADVFLSSHIDTLLQLYELRESGQIQPVVHWPWRELDEETGGISEEDFVLFWGRPKSKKTFVLNYVMASCYAEQQKRVLCYTKEMTPTNILLRTCAFMEKLPYQETRKAKLDAADKAALFQMREHIKEAAMISGGRNDLIVLSGKDANGRDGVMWLRSKIEQYKPDVCFVDGLYLMNDDRGSKRVNDPERVMHISRDTRQLVLESGVPIIATMQANRKAAQNSAAELDEIAYSDAVGQDITQGFRVINEKHSPTIALVAGGSREYDLHGIRINGHPCVNFDFLEVMTEKDIERASANDTGGEAEKAKAHSKARRRPRVGKGELDKMLEDQLKDL